MRKSLWKSNVRRRRGGFTVIELLVALSIIGVLVALGLPAIAKTRSSARRGECQSHLKELALAMTAEADQSRRLPASGNYGFDASGNFAHFHSWVVTLTPWLDQPTIAKQWQWNQPSVDPANQALARTHLKVLICPEDDTQLGGGDLSYVTNGGFGWTTVYSNVADCPTSPNGLPLDLNGNGVGCPLSVATDGTPGDKLLYLQTGVFFLESWRTPGTTRHHQLDSILDGLSQTIFLSENIRAGADPTIPELTWASPLANRNSFFLNLSNICPGASCAPGSVDYSRANQGLGAINSGRNEAEGEAPWPNSHHSGGVHFAFGDGRVKFANERIDGRVYASLVSPQGTLIQGELRQQLVSGDEL
jgi:prepilin-type N-terminal cleavage/methylation domain-containing protein